MGLSWGLVFETGSSSIVFYNRIVFKRCFETVLVWTRCLDYPNELKTGIEVWVLAIITYVGSGELEV